MVMADRYVEDIRNGRRFRNSSPNGFSEDSSDDEERGMNLCCYLNRTSALLSLRSSTVTRICRIKLASSIEDAGPR